MKTIFTKINDDTVKEAARILREGGIAALPTDTVYGLGAVYSDEEAVGKIFEAKGRNENKPLSILVGSIEQAEKLVDEVPKAARVLMEKFWPGALTVILKKAEGIPDNVSAGLDTIGLRMPANDFAIQLIKEAGPLAAPSANISGKRSAVSAEEVREDLDGRIDIIIDGGRCDIGISSTVVDLSTVTDDPDSRQGVLRILREGTVSEEDILEELTQKGLLLDNK